MIIFINFFKLKFIQIRQILFIQILNHHYPIERLLIIKWIRTFLINMFLVMILLDLIWIFLNRNCTVLVLMLNFQCWYNIFVLWNLPHIKSIWCLQVVVSVANIICLFSFPSICKEFNLALPSHWLLPFLKLTFLLCWLYKFLHFLSLILFTLRSELGWDLRLGIYVVSFAVQLSIVSSPFIPETYLVGIHFSVFNLLNVKFNWMLCCFV